LGFIKRIPNLLLKKKDPTGLSYTHGSRKKIVSWLYRLFGSKKKDQSGLSYRKMERRKRFAVLGVSVAFLLVAGFAVAGVIGSFSTGDLNKGLVGHWPLDGAHLNSTTNRVDDISGYGNHGTNNGASLTTDRYGQASGAMSFVASQSDYINCGSKDWFKGNTIQTVTLWFKSAKSAITGYMLRGEGSAQANRVYINKMTNDEIRVVIGSTSGTIKTAANWTANRWYHITIIRDAPNQKMHAYWNGVKVLDAGANPNQTSTGTDNLYLGSISPASEFLDGSLYEVRIYDRALSEPEIKKLYETYKPKFSVGSENKGLVGHWPLRPESEKVGSNVVTLNNGFEAETGGSVTNWGTAGNHSINAVVDGTAPEGNNVLEITATGSGNTSNYFLAIVPDPASYNDDNRIYRLSFWAKRISGVNPATIKNTGIIDEPYVTITDDWAYYSLEGSFDGSSKFALNYSESNTVIRFDYLTIKEIKAADLTPNSNHGEIYGAEIRNHGASFNGSSDYVGITDTSDLSFGNGSSDNPFSVSAWVNMDDATIFHIVNKDSSGAREYFFSTMDSDRLLLLIFDNLSGDAVLGRTGSIITSYEGQWIHVAAVYDGSSTQNGLNVYLNGVNDNVGTYTWGSYIAMSNGSAEIRIGRDGGSGYADGNISDVRVYDRALSADEVLELYQGADVAGAILDMPLSDKTGFKDISGNDNHGINYGADIIGEAGGFDGVDDYINLGSLTSSNLTNASVSFWRKADDTSAWLLFKGQTTGYYFMATHGTDNFYHGNCGSPISIYRDSQLASAPSIDGNWHHYVATNVNFSTWTIFEMSNYPNFHIHDYISDLKIYDRALSGPEITALYAKGRSGSSVGTSTTNLNKGLVGQWDLKSRNEKVGDNFVTSGYNGESKSGWYSPSEPTYGAFSSGASSGSGFTGNVLKYIANSTYSSHRFWAASGGQSEQFANGSSYRIQFKYRSSQTLRLMNRDTSIQDFVANTGDAISVSVDYSPTNITWDSAWILFRFSSDSGGYMEVDDIKIVRIKTADSTPYGNHGTVYGATVEDDYTSFDGTSDYVDCGDVSLGTEISVSWWMQSPGSALRMGIFYLGSAGIMTATSNFSTGFFWRINYPNQTPSISNFYVYDNNWHNYVAIRNDLNVEVYRDGEYIGESNFPGDNIAQSFKRIGYSLCGGCGDHVYSSGSISNVKIYDRALSGTEVKLLYDKGR